ncbi:hypothetical protein AVEN_153972-1 [Araneus ventricosus]|uniref:Uncharacterized protein n=1 Tax=Araneus ventricosus TaxID=182803 RepID=A0A4Y2MGH6_ARAVE|nr:hypothetical protein AVEN_153972-1 [Araneus ventricosus]
MSWLRLWRVPGSKPDSTKRSAVHVGLVYVNPTSRIKRVWCETSETGSRFKGRLRSLATVRNYKDQNNPRVASRRNANIIQLNDLP